LMIILREESEKRSLIEETEEIDYDGKSTANDSSQGTMNAGQQKDASSSYFSGFSSWAVGSISSQSETPASTTTQVVAPPRTTAPAPMPPVKQMGASDTVPSSSMADMSFDNDGWGDEDDIDNDIDNDIDFLDDNFDKKNELPQEPSWVSNSNGLTPNASKITSAIDEDAIFESAFSSTASKPVSMIGVNTTTTATAKSTAPKLIVNSKAKKKTAGMSLVDRKAEFERRKLERMEMRMKQFEKSKQGSKSTNSGNNASNSLNGWSSYSR